MTDNSNMRIWKSFPKTDEKYTKIKKEKDRTITSVSPVYMVKLATEVLGPIGAGWGYRILEERFDKTIPLILIEGDKAKGIAPTYMMDGGNIIWEEDHTVVIEMWVGEKQNTFVQAGHTRYRYKTSKGHLFIDHEYGKKSITDAMTKCLSLVGVCSDIYMGEFDDQNYRSIAKLENDLKKADQNDTVYVEKVSELRDYVKQMAAQMSLCPTIEAMQKVYTLANGKITREAPILGLDQEVEKQVINEAYKNQEAKINGEKHV